MTHLKHILNGKTHILWDFDGSFCDSETIHFEAYAKAFALAGHSINKDEYFTTFTHTGGGVAKEIENYNLSCDPEEIKINKIKFYNELITQGQAKLFPEMPLILKKLSQLNIKNVIASNSPKSEIELILSKLDEKVHVDAIFGLEAGLRKKPFPDIFNHALATLNISPKQSLVIEDSERGLIASKNAHCQAIWIETHITEKYSSTAPYLAKISHRKFLSQLNDELELNSENVKASF